MKRWTLFSIGLSLFLTSCANTWLNWQRESLGYVRLATLSKSPTTKQCIEAALVSSRSDYTVLQAKKAKSLSLLRNRPYDVRDFADRDYAKMHTVCKDIATPEAAIKAAFAPQEASHVGSH
jgi:hypothetical protein